MRLWLSLIAVALLVVQHVESNLQQREQFILSARPQPRLPSLDLKIQILLKNLLSTVQSKQAKQSSDYRPRFVYPPKQWYRQEGIYDSFVHLNFHGQFPKDRLLRNGYKFPDENAFVTLFVAHALAEVGEYFPEDYLKISDDELWSAVRAISTHQDRNVNGTTGVPLMNFWNQQEVEVNGTTRYRQTPVNINIPLSEASKGLKFLDEQLQKVGLDGYFKLVGTAASFAMTFTNVFGIPPDSDDTGCNLALGYKLLTMRDRFPRATQLWLQLNKDSNADIMSYFDQYAYRPFSEEYVQKSIDPRTYFWIRGFLHEERAAQSAMFNGSADLTLITTWMQSIDQIQHEVKYRRMPFSVNNVDASVTVNALYGISGAVLSRPELYESTFNEKMYMDNIRLVAWILKNRIVERYDSLALLYYPPKFAFYWFVARLSNLLNNLPEESSSKISSNTVKVFQDAGAVLLENMQKFGTEEILKSAKKDSIYVYWDDFLGNGDVLKANNQTIPAHEDRVFSTAMAMNALLDTWTTRHTPDSGPVTLRFLPNTPSKVVSTINAAFNWLVEVAWLYPKENAFFSGSIKNGRATPFYFPHNSFRWTNGTSAGKCSDIPNSAAIGGFASLNLLVASVSGLIPEEEYEQMIESHECLGGKFPADLIGASLNCQGCVFPYWSSPALTEAQRMLAIAKFSALELSK